VRIQGFAYSFVFRGLLQLLILSWTATQRNAILSQPGKVAGFLDAMPSLITAARALAAHNLRVSLSANSVMTGNPSIIR
jgi:hypothetical protein